MAEVVNEVNTLNINKSNPQNSVSAQHLKEYIDICGEILLEIINKSIINSDFEEAIKLADITPVHKQDDVTNKVNYRPISLVSFDAVSLFTNMPLKRTIDVIQCRIYNGKVIDVKL